MTLSINEFVRAAAKYKTELEKRASFNDIHALWQRTTLKYAMPAKDPFSAAYRQDVLTLYQKLAAVGYDESNELTSTKIDEAQFKRGYPWVTNRLDVIGSELVKVCQAMQALHPQALAKPLNIIEFGCGWGNLAYPLAKAGQNITAVDIDKAFLDRLTDIFARDGLEVTTIHADFVTAAQSVGKKYDSAIFQASFHHCLEFGKLLAALEEQVLEETGIVYFFSEPVFAGYQFPWGLRYDGESLWAIMINKWLELGFDQDFFSELLLLNGFFLEEIPQIPGHLGAGWKGVRSSNLLDFQRWTMPRSYHDTFHEATGPGGRFCRARSRLPMLKGRRRKYQIMFRNYGTIPLQIGLSCGRGQRKVTIAPSQDRCELLEAGNDELVISSDVFVPDKLVGNGDRREVGAAIVSVSCC